MTALRTYTPAEADALTAHYIARAKAIGEWKARAPAHYLPIDRKNVNKENGPKPVGGRPRSATRGIVLRAIADGHGRRRDVIAATGISSQRVASCIYRLRLEGLIATKSNARSADAVYRIEAAGLADIEQGRAAG